MSRSRRKHPFFGWTKGSEKDDKIEAHKAQRRKTKEKLQRAYQENDDFVPLDKKEVVGYEDGKIRLSDRDFEQIERWTGKNKKRMMGK